MALPLTTAKLRQALQAAETRYFRLALLVGAAGSGKTKVLREIAREHGVPLVNVNLELSAALLDLTPKQRVSRLPDVLAELAEGVSSLLVLDNLELLFDPTLRHDPLRLLQSLSRNRVVPAAWNGEMRAGRLVYAEPGHPEYRCYDAPDALIVGMDGASTID